MDEMEPLAAELRMQVLSELEERTGPLVSPPWDELREQIHRLDSALQQANAWRARDPQGAMYLKIGCCVLAVYRTLAPHFEDKQDLLDQIRNVIHLINFQGGMDAFLLDHYGISPEEPEDAWNQICSNFIPKGRKRYGSGWVVEQGIRDDRRCFFNFYECGLADFFLNNDAREVLYLFCATDYIWGGALEEKYGIRFERPTMLSEGADACRFQLFRAKNRTGSK
jgi:hypothetical protein